MSFEIQTMPTANKQTRYEHLIEDIATLISGEHREISVMANVAAAIRQAFSFFWVGFYVVDGDHLHLGPFQGDVACYRIRHGRAFAEQPGPNAKRWWFPTLTPSRATSLAVPLHAPKSSCR